MHCSRHGIEGLRNIGFRTPIFQHPFKTPDDSTEPELLFKQLLHHNILHECYEAKLIFSHCCNCASSGAADFCFLTSLIPSVWLFSDRLILCGFGSIGPIILHMQYFIFSKHEIIIEYPFKTARRI